MKVEHAPTVEMAIKTRTEKKKQELLDLWKQEFDNIIKEDGVDHGVTTSVSIKTIFYNIDDPYVKEAEEEFTKWLSNDGWEEVKIWEYHLLEEFPNLAVRIRRPNT